MHVIYHILWPGYISIPLHTDNHTRDLVLNSKPNSPPSLTTRSHYSNCYRGLGFGYGSFISLSFGNGFGYGGFHRLGCGCGHGGYGYGSGYGNFGYGYHCHPFFYGRYGFSSFYWNPTPGDQCLKLQRPSKFDLSNWTTKLTLKLFPQKYVVSQNFGHFSIVPISPS